MKVFNPTIKPDLVITYYFADKEVVHDEIFNLLYKYPQNFLHSFFEEIAEKDYRESEIMIAQDGERIIGCVFYNPMTHEFNWLAVSPEIKTGKSTIAKNLFEKVFATLPKGSSYYWYVNTEDSIYPGYPHLGSFFEPARRLYKSMGLRFSREENKFGPGTHTYRVEGEV